MAKVKTLVVKAHPSLISFQVAPSNIAKSPSVEELGQTTSQAHCPSAQSSTVKLSLFPLVSVMVTVVVFQTLELVILAIQFQVAHVSPVSHLGIPKLNTAADEVQLLVTVALSQASKVVVVQTLIVAACQLVPSAPLGIVKFKTAALLVQELVTEAEVHAAHVVVDPTHTVAALPVSHFSPFRLEYCAFLILSPSSLSLKSIKSSCAMEFFSS